MIDLGINLFQEIAALGGGGGYPIVNSLRFNDNDSAYLSRTPSVTSNRKTWTWSAWVKRANLTNSVLFEASSGSSVNHTQIAIFNDQLRVFSSVSSVTRFEKVPTAVFRDVSGWYHIQVTVDTTDATASDRIKIWVNGNRLTVFTTSVDAALNNDTNINVGSYVHTIGKTSYTSANYLDGYMAEVNFIDGQALTADDFGEINATTGEWSPIPYAGTYGTNGFYLPFDGNANDDSGNGNNWTENNLASTDYMIDTPTNNFSVLNSVATITSLSEGNLKTTTTATGVWQSAVSTIGVSSGKWYFETCAPQALTDPPYVFIGITTNPNHGSISPNYLGLTADSWGLLNTGSKYNSESPASYASSYTLGDVIGCALDMDAGTVEFFKNNVSQGVAFTGLTGTMFCGASVYTLSGTASNNINFGQDSSFAGLKTRQGNTDANGIGDFYYAPPTGYLALCTDNLPAPAIEQPETQFNVVTYTGDGTSNNAITGVGFQPDFVWIKRRDAAQSHILSNSVNGAGVALVSNVTSAEFSIPSEFLSFDSDGFTVGYSTAITNNSGSPYVAWCWKAGGTAVSNTDGSITSQVSANVDAGFSIVSYTGNGATASVGHGLQQKPDFIITKSRNNVGNWFVQQYMYVPSGNAAYGYLNLTDAFVGFTDTLTTDSVFQQGGGSGVTYISYCFHSVEGFSKFGSYVGNGSTNGTFVYTGFKPAFVMIKRTDSSTNGSWVIKDNLRAAEYNPSSGNLYADLNFAEDTVATANVDLLANGFKLRGAFPGVNASGGTYIYMAFAEHPFKYATGR